MTSEQQAYIDFISHADTDTILLKESGWEVVDLPPHTHACLQIVHTLSGTLRIKAGEACCFVPEHHVVWIPAGMEHRLSSNNRQIALQIICCPAITSRKDMFTVYNTNTFIGENLRFIGRSAPEVCRRKDPEMFDFIMGFLRLFPVKGEEYRIPLRTLFIPHDKRLQAILGYIDSHIGEQLGKEELAERFGISARNLSRLFHNADIHFSSYLNYQRVTRAIELFADHDKTIEQIAYEVGFNSPNHFNRVFKQLMGSSPGAFYRKK